MSGRWPERLWLVRHGESAGNVARALADEAGHGRIAIDIRDVDVPLSPLGERQDVQVSEARRSRCQDERWQRHQVP